jgi:hypothetical protein
MNVMKLMSLENGWVIHIYVVRIMENTEMRKICIQREVGKLTKICEIINFLN